MVNRTGPPGTTFAVDRGIVSNILEMRADPRTEAEVMHVLSRIAETASSGDVDGAIALFAGDPDVFLTLQQLCTSNSSR
jgi:hypothetical protein